MNKSISSLLNEVKIATQEYVTAKVLAGQLTDAELGIDMLKALESPLSISLLLDGYGKVAVKDYLQKIKLEAPNSYGRKISEYRCYVVVGALEKAGILEQKERGKYCYEGKRSPSPTQFRDALYTLKKREDLLSQAE